jgi:TetR/AcrR family transcriptional repressor of lmrAB and yxaGH operons
MSPTKESAAAPAARDRILDATILLMRQSGLTGAGINQIIAHSGAPKGSMYYYFPEGKQQIAAEALVRYAERVAAGFERVLSTKRKPGDKIRALFRLVADRLEAGAFEHSCAVGAVTLDLDTEAARLRAVVESALASWQSLIARHLPMCSRARRESFAGLVISAIEGAYIRGRAERSKKPFREAGDWLARLLEHESD